MSKSKLVCIIVYKQVGLRGEGDIDLDASKRRIPPIQKMKNNSDCVRMSRGFLERKIVWL